MKNQDKWKPSKFVFKKKRLIASRDPNSVSISSRLVADLIASYYEKYLPLYSKGTLIDLGCGEVPFFEVYKSYVNEIVCVDWASTFHDIAFADFYCDLNDILPFENEKFDTIILSDVLEHISRPQLLICEMSRILVKNGKIIMNVPFIYNLHEIPHDYYRYTEYGLKFLIESCGLRTIYISPIGGFPEVLGDMSAKFAFSIPFFGKELSIFIQRVTSVFIKTSLGKKISNKSSHRYPLGYFLVLGKSQEK
jgi:SAM-dependent methyltransferase